MQKKADNRQFTGDLDFIALALGPQEHLRAGMEETRKAWIERQSPGTWAAALTDSVRNRSAVARQDFSKSLCGE